VPLMDAFSSETSKQTPGCICSGRESRVLKVLATIASVQKREYAAINSAINADAPDEDAYYAGITRVRREFMGFDEAPARQWRQVRASGVPRAIIRLQILYIVDAARGISGENADAARRESP